MLQKLLALYRPAPFRPRIPAEEVPARYKAMRLQVMSTIFAGYAGFYIVRQNFSFAKPYLISEWGLSKGDVGLIATALTVAYGISKFLMGNVSDRSNPRYFMATGLILSGLVNLAFGFMPSMFAMVCLWFVNGWAQGMGWAPCARTLTHWFSDRERGTKFAVWNLAHNVGGGITGQIATLAVLMFVSWKSVFYVPGMIAVVLGAGIIAFLRDTPQSEGLPPVEEFSNDRPDTGVDDPEKELGAKEIFTRFVLCNKWLWVLAFANVFVYVVRYGVVNWAPTYLTAVKCATHAMTGWQVMVFETAGIPGTLLAGWASDRYFSGRRGPVSVVYMLIVTLAVIGYWVNPAGRPWIDCGLLFVIGFLIYGPVMLIGVAAVDLVPKKAAGTAAGFTGLFGYLGGATVAELGIGRAVDAFGWTGGFVILLGSCALSIVFMGLMWNKHHRTHEEF
ncbi:MAG: phosphoglycerate transporter protein PgtP [Elusimicrobiaceae bacterium]|nr:phosphoglycerate transporter protein PgtP [Elusimicrobiaceae bacterium]